MSGKKREGFWKELNEARGAGISMYWPGVFPAASIIDFNLLVEVNQYLSESTGQNFLLPEPSTVLSPAHTDDRIRPFFTEFIENYKRVDTEIDWNSLLFFSIYDGHHSVHLHKDVESVFLIQGNVEVGFLAGNDDRSKKDFYHMKTGDVLLYPPMYAHKSVPFGPRVTLSLGGLPKKHEQQRYNMN